MLCGRRRRDQLLSHSGEIGGEGEQCDTASPLDGAAQLALMARAVTGNPTRNDLPPICNEISESLSVLEIDRLNLINAPLADLLPPKAPSLFQHPPLPP
jgi:hypothetical protein